jgi:hypothetical protein
MIHKARSNQHAEFKWSYETLRQESESEKAGTTMDAAAITILHSRLPLPDRKLFQMSY